MTTMCHQDHNKSKYKINCFNGVEIELKRNNFTIRKLEPLILVFLDKQDSMTQVEHQINTIHINKLNLFQLISTEIGFHGLK